MRRLAFEGCEVIAGGRDVVDLTRQTEVEGWVSNARPNVIFMATANVGGTLANDTHPVDFLI